MPKCWESLIIPADMQERNILGKTSLSMIWGHTWHRGQCWTTKWREVSLFKTAWGEVIKQQTGSDVVRNFQWDKFLSPSSWSHHPGGIQSLPPDTGTAEHLGTSNNSSTGLYSLCFSLFTFRNPNILHSSIKPGSRHDSPVIWRHSEQRMKSQCWWHQCKYLNFISDGVLCHWLGPWQTP